MSGVFSSASLRSIVGEVKPQTRFTAEAPSTPRKKVFISATSVSLVTKKNSDISTAEARSMRASTELRIRGVGNSARAVLMVEPLQRSMIFRRAPFS